MSRGFIPLLLSAFVDAVGIVGKDGNDPREGLTRDTEPRRVVKMLRCPDSAVDAVLESASCNCFDSCFVHELEPCLVAVGIFGEDFMIARARVSAELATPDPRDTARTDPAWFPVVTGAEGCTDLPMVGAVRTGFRVLAAPVRLVRPAAEGWNTRVAPAPRLPTESNCCLRSRSRLSL